jgi:hypothetical protein
MRIPRFAVILLVVMMAVTGCQTIKRQIAGLVVDKGEREKEIAALKSEYEGKIEKKAVEVSSAKDKVIAGKDTQIAAASSGLFGADQTFKTITSPVRTDLIINNFVNESWVALGRQAPDYQTLTKINERVKLELDESRTSLSQLQINHQKVVSENQKLADQTRAFETALKRAEAEKSELAAKFSKDLVTKQGELLGVQNKLIALEAERANDRAAIQAIKTKFSMILGGLALLSLAGAVYSPLGKMELAVFAGLTGLAAVGIWWIQPFHVAIAAGVIVVGLVTWALIKYRKEEKIADAMVLTLQDLKTGSADVWENTVKPVVQERLKKYKTGANGKITTVVDPALEKEIDKKLAAYEAK